MDLRGNIHELPEESDKTELGPLTKLTEGEAKILGKVQKKERAPLYHFTKWYQEHYETEGVSGQLVHDMKQAFKAGFNKALELSPNG